MITISPQNNHSQAYLQQKLAWTTRRIAALQQIENKLKEMHFLATHAQGHRLTTQDAQRMNTRLSQLQQEINTLDTQTKTFQPHRH